jgi:threonyl-tRNA synthetase
MFPGNRYKAGIAAQAAARGEGVTLYKVGSFVDLCRGPHIPHAGLAAAARVTNVSAAGTDGAGAAQRVAAVSFPTARLLDEWRDRERNARASDHRAIGQRLGLFFFHRTSPGAPFFLPAGTKVFNALVAFIRAEYAKVCGFMFIYYY